MKKKNPVTKQDMKANYAALKNAVQKTDNFLISEPWTLAQARLEGGARDKGAARGLKLYNAHKIKLQNQWVNPLQSVNSGWGNTHLSFFLYQPVNYYECYSLAQDPLFTKVFNLLSITPFAKGGEIVFDDADGTQKNIEKDKLEKLAKEYDVWEHIQAAVHSNYVTGGCLLYMDFGQTESELREPLNLNKMSMKRFKGFRHIDPINCVAVNVNTVDPAAADYMKPKIWYVIGLGTVDESHFLKFEENLPELPMRPLTLYFGMPLTQLIKQDVANSNLASQGLANLMNRFRYVYLKTEESNFVTANAPMFREKLDFMSFSQDNFGVCPLKSTEEVLQLTTSLTGMAENVELFYLLVAAKTDTRNAKRSITKSMRQLYGDDFAVNWNGKDIDDILRLIIRRNVGLIENTTLQTLNNIENIVYDGVTTGQTWGTVAKDLSTQKHISSDRIKRIARDQTGKANEALNEAAQLSAGIEFFEWRTAEFTY